MISTALFDANVLFGARLRSLLMELAMSGLFRARWSPDIHREWMQAVSEKRGISIAQLNTTRFAMDESVPDGCVTGYEDLIAGLALPDPNDRHVLAAAIRCGANVIVTFNAADFPSEAIEKYGLDTRHPDAFIIAIDDVDPGALIDAGRRDMAHYKNPPLTLEEYLDGLRAGGVPMTADRLAGLHEPLGG
jgi:predicted nucleic acid-binding protein